MFSLEGKTALVTGASRGIGRMTAITLAAMGANVVVNYNGSEDKANEVVKTISEAGGKAIAVKCNVADMSQCEEMVAKAIEAFGQVDILVNNAGITRDNLILKMKEEEFDQVIEANLKGTYNTIKILSKIMLKQRYGRIINLSSVSGVHGNPGQVNYAASKAGVIGITKSVAKELASRNITCNAVAPGYIETDMTEAMSDKAKEAILNTVPAGRGGKPEEVAALIAYLASSEAAYVTGQVIEINGGMA